jgi:hypothetical protein
MALTTGSTKQAQAQRDRSRRIVVADQLELVVRGDARVDKQIRHHGEQAGAEIDQKGRQPGERLKNHVSLADLERQCVPDADCRGFSFGVH